MCINMYMCVCVNTYIQLLSQTFQESVDSMAFSSIVIHPDNEQHKTVRCICFITRLSFGMVSVDLFCKLEGAAIYIFPLVLNRNL